VSKTVKGDIDLIHHILFNGLSAFTIKPTHLMVMEKSSEGKTYPALQISQHFPKENVITLGSVTPMIFKYEYGILVDENYQPIEDKLSELEIQIKAKKSKGRQKQDGTTLQELEARKKDLEKNARHLIDMRNKWIIFKEPPDPKLLEGLYSTLSSDEEYNEHRFVDRVKGANKTSKVVFRGTPAILICTAKDETKHNRWDETVTRFRIVSPVSTPQKYRDGMGLISKSHGLPKKLYEEHVMNKSEKERISEIIKKLISQVQAFDGEVTNPFLDESGKQFPHENGARWRQYKDFLVSVSLHCLCYSEHRPKVIIDDETIPFVIKADIVWALSIMKDNSSIPPNKMKWFEEVFVPSFNKYAETVHFPFSGIERKCIYGHQIKKHVEDVSNSSLTVKQMRETYLETLFDHGFIEKEKDPRNNTRDVYWPVEDHETKPKSSFIAIESLDKSCVELFIEKYLQRRFSYEYRGQKITEDELIQIILSDKNVIQDPKTEFKTADDGMKINEVLMGGENSGK
jgi:hypothetical protein